MSPLLIKYALGEIEGPPAPPAPPARPPHPADLFAAAAPEGSTLKGTLQLQGDLAHSRLPQNDPDWRPFPVTGSAEGTGINDNYKEVSPWLRMVTPWIRSYLGLPGINLHQLGDKPAFTGGFWGVNRSPGLIEPAAQSYAARLGGLQPGAPGFSNVMTQLPLLMGQSGMPFYGPNF